MQKISLDECLEAIVNRNITVVMHLGPVNLAQQEKCLMEIRDHGDLVYLLFDDDELITIKKESIKEITVEDDEYTITLTNQMAIIIFDG